MIQPPPGAGTRDERPLEKRHRSKMERAMVESLGEDVRYCIERSIPGGDAVCDHVIARRTEPGGSGPEA